MEPWLHVVSDALSCCVMELWCSPGAHGGVGPGPLDLALVLCPAAAAGSVLPDLAREAATGPSRDLCALVATTSQQVCGCRWRPPPCTWEVPCGQCPWARRRTAPPPPASPCLRMRRHGPTSPGRKPRDVVSDSP
jgi:hypothetical protein